MFYNSLWISFQFENYNYESPFFNFNMFRHFSCRPHGVRSWKPSVALVLAAVFWWKRSCSCWTRYVCIVTEKMRGILYKASKYTFKRHNCVTHPDRRLPPWLKWILPSSGLLRGVRWFETDVSGPPISTILRGPAVQEENRLTSEVGTDR
jgi:hypothetical protein